MKRTLKVRAVAAFCTILLQASIQPLPARADDFTLESAQLAAAAGDAKALYFLAKCYAKGQGVPQDNAKAAEYMQRSAEKGYAFAQNDFGTYYAKGLGVKQDFVQAAKWYRKAAVQGDPLAQFSMGKIYSQGRGVPKDMQESVKWYKMAAKQNQADAMMALGDIYLCGGEGFPINCKEAFSWFQKARQKGRIEALNYLGYIYEQGDPNSGIIRDLKLAANCYREAAEAGNPKGQLNLGRMYLDGQGVEKDWVEAYKWFYLANLNGEGVSKHFLQELQGRQTLSSKRQLNSDQIKEALRRAHEWQKATRKPKPN